MGVAAVYDRAILPRLLTFACGMKPIGELRQQVVPLATGRVFEIGCGGGLNFSLYDAARVTELAGIDPHENLLERARHKAADSGLSTNLRAGVGEDIPFRDSTFDTVVCTYTLCSVEEPERVMSEMRRVLRPGGKVLFLEHGRAPDPSVVKWQNRIEPVWKRLAGGCHLTRPVGSGLRGAGFSVEPIGRKYLANAPKVAGWMEWGIAHKP